MTHSLPLARNSASPDTAAAGRTIAIAGDDCPEWVQLIPAGTFRGVDGRGPWVNDDAERVIATSRAIAGTMDYPIDYGHAMEVEVAGNLAMGAEAAGWITELEARKGEVWGKVEWTALAAQKIKNKHYRGISPVFHHDAQGVVQCLVRAGLTNRPNLHIRSLNAQQGTTTTEESSVTEAQLKALRARFVATLGLPETADDDALIARCSAAVQAESTIKQAATTLALNASATGADVLTAIQAVQAKGTAVDPTKFVPLEQYTAVCAQLTAANATQVDAAVDAAITAGKITPANRDWAKSLASSNRKSFDEFVAKAPVIVDGGKEINGQAKTEASAGTLSDLDKAICAQTGVAEADFLKNKETTK